MQRSRVRYNTRTSIYNASDVKIYNATKSSARLYSKNYFSLILDAPVTCIVVVVVCVCGGAELNVKKLARIPSCEKMSNEYEKLAHIVVGVVVAFEPLQVVIIGVVEAEGVALGSIL
jgi:hypothetical protein